MEQEARVAGEVLDVGRVEIGFVAAQAVVDVGHDELERPRPGHTPQQLEQHARVATARDRDDHPNARETERIEARPELALERRPRMPTALLVLPGSSHPRQHSRRARSRSAPRPDTDRASAHRRPREPARPPTDRAIRYSRRAMSRTPEAALAVDPDREVPADVGRWIDFWAMRQPDVLAWADDERRCSWRDAADQVARLADWLVRQGVEAGSASRSGSRTGRR
ncbi:MAG: hypothetical protein U0900_01635 [Myxococcota bacterium]